MDWFLDNADRVVAFVADEEQPNLDQLKSARHKLDEMIRDYDQGWDPVAIRAEEEGGEEGEEDLWIKTTLD
jgi:hypothetical protein